MEGASGDSIVGSPKHGEYLKPSSDDGAKKSHHNGPKENGTSNGSMSNSHHHHKDKHKSHHSSSKHHSSSGEKKHSSSSHSGDKKHHSSSSHGDKKHSSSSSSKHSSSHKHSSSSSGEKKHHTSSSSSGEKKHHSSSSSHGDKKPGSSSSGEKKHSSSSSSEKKHSSSSGEKKHVSSSSSSSKHKHSSSSSSKHKEHKHRHSGEHEVKKEEVKVEPMEIKEEIPSPVKEPKPMLEDSEDDMPLMSRKPAVASPPVKRELTDDEDDDQPLAARKEKKVKAEVKVTPAARKRKMQDEDYDDDDEPLSKKKKKAKPTAAKTPPAKGKKGKAKQEEAEKWRWWEEERVDDGTKWKFLEHSGPVLAPDYEPLPDNVKFYYDGKHMKLTQDTEEVMTFYGRMIDHEYTTMDTFNKNFFKDWRSVMTSEEKEKIKDLKKCKFNEINVHFKLKSEERKAMSKEERLKIKEENARMVEEYGFCTMDKHKEKIGNFKIEPPGLFRGRGTHPKMGMHKRRVMPEEVVINCSKDSKWPQPPPGHKWKEVRHDNTVTWLASWTENVQGGTKYVMLNPASRLKGEKDWMKYETARKLYSCVDKIRANYRDDWKSKEMRVRQRAVALYFIDKLALRAGNEKDEDTADTVGCCSLRVEHLSLHDEKDGKEFVVEFDFLGKDSIRYHNMVAVEKRVYKNLQLFMDNKQPGDDLFDRLNTAIMNKHLQSLMDGLTAKVFRTFNASRTLQEQLNLLTNEDDPPAAKLLSYNRANRAVAVLCNHQRATPKNFDKQMENIQAKIDAKHETISNAKRELKSAKSDLKNQKTEKAKGLVDRKKKSLARLEEQLTKLEVALTDKDENKQIALGTSKLNYLDPRISVAWCKKWEVPIEKIYNKTQRDKFAWAIDMADEDYTF